MRLTKRKKHLSGMTLIEVTVGMVIIIIVTLIAYMGVSASANFTARGTDLRNADGPAVSMVEAQREAAMNAVKNNETPAVTEVVIKYQVICPAYFRVLSHQFFDGFAHFSISSLADDIAESLAEHLYARLNDEYSDNNAHIGFKGYSPDHEDHSRCQYRG